jgi:transcriptional regulator with XRE-family HTH domain
VSKQKSDRIIEFVAKRCKELRVNKKLTQLDVVNDTGMTISRIETGNMDITITTIQKLSDYYGITVAEFFKDHL